MAIDTKKDYVVEETVVKFKCLAKKEDDSVCGYTWIPRTDVEPKKCPECQSRNWKGDEGSE